MTIEKTEKSPRWSEDSGYSKGSETRLAILHAGLKAFGEAPYDAISTRQIAALAGVNQPAINYYFKGKEGLYLACARYIVEEYYLHTGDVSQKAAEILTANPEPEQARSALKNLMRALSMLLISSERVALSSAFIDREIRNPGPAHELVYEELWAPGTDLVARLISAICEVPPTDPQSRITAIMMISSLIGFASGKGIALKMMGWPRISNEGMRMILKTLEQQIDALS